VNPCLLIPIYEHRDSIGDVLKSLERHGLPCLVVDDGSGPETRAVLRGLAAHHPWVRVHTRPRNGGRGAALKTGYRLAAGLGYTHVVQLDADAQHDAADVPRFVAVLRDAPEALVLGVPLFDGSAPRIRLYGRQLSRALVWITTLSFDVADPLCGFRGIPLASTLAWLDEAASGDHMEFDPELVIALRRRGVPIRSVPTRVVYNPGGLSHFDALRDNRRLARVYARALFTTPATLMRRLRPRRGAAGQNAS